MAAAAAATTIELEKVPVLGTNLTVVNQDGQYETLLWTTTPENIKRALRSGVFSPEVIQSPIAKMIAQIGRYKRSTFELKIEQDGLVSRRSNEKLHIADMAQDYLEALQGVHANINNYNELLSPKIILLW